MATNTQAITGVITKPGGTAVTGGIVRFELSGVDADLVAAEVLPPNITDAVIGATGAVSVDLWPNTRGFRGSQYHVKVRVPAEKGDEWQALGRIQVGEAGPYELSDLLAATIPAPESVFYSIISQAEYDAAIAAVADAEAARDAAAVFQVQVFATYADALAYSIANPTAVVFSEEAAP